MSPVTDPVPVATALDAVFARVILDFCRRENVTTLPPAVLAYLEETARDAIMETTPPDEPIEVQS